MTYDALLFVSFGGPEGPDDVMPFLENVLRGKNVPHERMMEVAEHYKHFGGVSPINAQNRALIAALQARLAEDGPEMPVYFGNRNWHPLLPATLQQMADDGVQNALAFFTSPYSSYSSCRQYRENIVAARQEVGDAAPQISKLRAYYNHPGFIEPMAEMVQNALQEIPPARRAAARVLFTAHSIPNSMADNCDYASQLAEASRLVAQRCNVDSSHWRLVYQSRSGPPQQPWLEPDVGDAIEEIVQSSDVKDLVVAPIGFISDHIEVMFDLDEEAKDKAESLGVNMVRAATVARTPDLSK